MHSRALGPLQVAQVAAQLVQIRSAVARQAVLSYLRAGQLPEQLWHCVPSKKPPTPHIEHCESEAVVQVTVEAHSVTAVQEGQLSAVSLTRRVPESQLAHC